MSQYGAYGYAEAGKDYRFILAHYYTGTALGELTSQPEVRVLLSDGRASYTVAGAVRVGNNKLDASKTYTLVRGGKGVILRDGKRDLFTGTAPMRVQAPAGGSLWFNGARWRGAMEFRPSGGGLMAVNALGLEDYVRGVVARESPSSWPAEALKAQAVAARTYAITTGGGAAFDQYADTRSQVYGGVSAETAATDAAVRATAGQVVTYQGNPVTTYFFSTSGGRTENIENSWPGAAPKPWLRSVRDPYDKTSPWHRWPATVMSAATAQKRLGGYLKGRFVRIDVASRGRSPRIVSATVVGTRGTTTVSGPTLRSIFGLRDTWAYFTTVTTGVKRKPVKQPAPPDALGGTPMPSDGSSGSNGGASSKAARAAQVVTRTVPVLHGTVKPGKRGQRLRVQRRVGSRWVTVSTVKLGKGARYEARVRARGLYRVNAGNGILGPSTRVS
jgi:stage II sporulation protein D